MDRLTVHIGDTVGMAWEHEEKHTIPEWIDMLHEHLCAYEDTGLTPAEVMELQAENKELRGRLERVRVAAMP